VVHLGGVVANDAERARAEQLASQVGGVKRVINDLQVQKR
jgi:osmotically-inducible protein OsmY